MVGEADLRGVRKKKNGEGGGVATLSNGGGVRNVFVEEGGRVCLVEGK